MRGLDIHAGIWLALERAGIVSAANVGTSAGAMVSACDSAGWTAEMFCDYLRILKDSDVRRDRFAWQMRVLFMESFLSNAPIRQVLTGILPATFAELRKPLTVWAVLEATATPWGFSSGPLVNAVMASAAISGVFPSITDDQGRSFCDGGTAKYLPVPADLSDRTDGTPRNAGQAAGDTESGFDEIWLLIADPPQEYSDRGGNVISRLLRNVDWMQDGQIYDAIALAQEQADDWERGPEGLGQETKRMTVHVVRPKVDPTGSSLHFDHRLIEAARKETERILSTDYTEAPEKMMAIEGTKKTGAES